MKSNFLIFVILFAAISVTAQSNQSEDFLKVFEKISEKTGIKCDVKDSIHLAILREYGAVFISHGATLPKTCYMDESGVTAFMKNYKTEKDKFKFGKFYLQSQAKEKLQIVFDAFDALEGYKYVARNWNKTVGNLKSVKGDLNDDWAQRDYEQAEFNWKKHFKDKTVKEIIESSYGSIRFYAIPGASQHHLGLAIDVNNRTSNSDDKRCNKKDKKTHKYCRICGDKCEKLLNDNGWFRTIRYDEFHFTYLGWTKDKELRKQGLKQVKCGAYKYWVPYMKGFKEECKNV